MLSGRLKYIIKKSIFATEAAETAWIAWFRIGLKR
jgi:hypothetical protein